MKVRKDGIISMDYNDKIVIHQAMTNASAANEDVAKLMSGDINKLEAVKSRKKKIKQLGLIESETIQLNPKYFGLNYNAIVMVKLIDTKNMAIFEDTVKVLTDVRSCKLVKGEYDYVLHTLNKDYSDHTKFIEWLYNTDLISKINTMEIKNELLSKPQIPLL